MGVSHFLLSGSAIRSDIFFIPEHSSGSKAIHPIANCEKVSHPELPSDLVDFYS